MQGDEIPSSKARSKRRLESFNAGAYATQGARASMEDVHSLVLWKQVYKPNLDEKTSQNFLNEDISNKPSKRICIRDIDKSEEQSGKLNTEASMFLVCDGHGGKEAAEVVQAHFFNKIMGQSAILEKPEEAIMKCFEEIESDFKKNVQEKDLDGLVGTTVTFAIIINQILYVANLGDSAASICSKGVSTLLTKCHSTDNADERLRVEQEGGKLVSDRTGVMRLGHPVWNSDYVNIGVTRAIGDFYFKSREYIAEKQSGLIAIPSITKRKITPDDQFVLIASDGFWEVVGFNEASEVVLSNFHMDSFDICKELVELSKERECKDNVTVLLIKFKDNDKHSY